MFLENKMKFNTWRKILEKEADVNEMFFSSVWISNLVWMYDTFENNITR